ncbi:hypothetical protein JQX08_17450 [Pseudomonas sp. UL073]|uniref:Integral membrane protein n=1 Tax=Zestomonas insulae TaxID=2809017 RepID=A0ABS2IHF0_9GAMM|nr:hypothetical protein [Pseudomonas insulae]MBM7062502.1 hypothetical protein [Pseudomonas insulae]
MTAVQPSLLLRRALYADGLISGATGLLLMLAADVLSSWLELPRALLFGAGASLLPFALALAWLASRARIQRGAVWAVIAVNALWVLDSLLLLVSGWVAPNLLGYAFVIAQALAVLLFIELELLGLKQSQAQALPA